MSESNDYTLCVIPRTLHFKQPAGTSRGVYTTRKIWLIKLTSTGQPGRVGIGECAPLPNLSCDDLPDYETILKKACEAFRQSGRINTEILRPYPSILFGLETAVRHFEQGSYALWDTPFSRGETGIPINGLIWMGSHEQMLEQIKAKIASGFRCIKVKIGAIRFEEEVDLLQHIRRYFSSREVELRVDANGAFSPAEAMDKLKCLSELDLHSIEQPIRAGQWQAMSHLAASSPIPIALDEELIGIHNYKEKQTLLQTIQPSYVILKPSLHGGITGCTEWIHLAESLGIGWWCTSALESNIGLNAIAQWCATLGNPLPQGLGTGALFTDNTEMPLDVRSDSLWYDPLKAFLAEWNAPSPSIEVQTSGSTGTPKRLIVGKEKMKQSARLTCEYLGLHAGDTALLCMPLSYIAGKMMVVRSLVAGLNLIVRQPSGHPLRDVDVPVRFAAMIPMQVYNTLQVPEEAEKLRQIEILIIGGGAIDSTLEAEIRKLPNAVYSTYGMTETLSHIALRRLNGAAASERYVPFPSVHLSLSDEGTLVIDAPLVCDEQLTTNDVAHLFPDGSFVILGRKDNIINSGGIKIQAEALEETLRPLISTPFAITSVSHPRFGEAVVLLVANPEEELTEKIKGLLSRYQQPKHILAVEAIALTANGKIDRAACRRLAKELLPLP